jgi:hypothetical protein
VARPSKHLLVWLHVLTSVGWLSQALALFALTCYGLAARDPALRQSAFAMADVLDREILLYLANGAAFSGIMLAALTPWGYFVHWWVLVKFAITLSQLYLGIFLLSPQLSALATGVAPDTAPATVRLAGGSVLMASAIGFQAWLSVAKPWRRTPWAGAARPPAGPGWLYWYACGVPVADYLIGRLLGFPMIGLEVISIIWVPIWRARRPARPMPVAQ